MISAINSVLDQTFNDFELVVTDDGSTDATPLLISALAAKESRIDFQAFPKNQGIAATMWATVQRARGEFLAILNSDDLALPNRLERQVTFLRAHPNIAAVFCLPLEIDDYGQPLVPSGIFGVPFPHAAPSRAEWLRHFFFVGNCLCAPSATIRRSVLLELGPDDPRLHLLMDLDRWVRLLSKYEIYVEPEPLASFRWHQDSSNESTPGRRKTQLRHAFESLQILRRYRNLKPDLLRTIFASDIDRAQINVQRPTSVWLADVALLGLNRWHKLFGLDLLFEEATEPHDFRRIRELSGEMDIFGLNAG